MTAVAVAMAKTATLGANTADTVTFSGVTATKCEVINLDASAVIWARFDGTPATVAGDDCVPIPANSTWTPPGTITTLSLISSAAPQYTVNRIL